MEIFRINKMEKSIDELFEPSGEQEEIEITLEEVNVVSNGTKLDILDDYKFAREKIILSIVRASEVLTEAVKETKMSPGPRAIEAAAAIVKNLNECTEKLMILHEKIRKIDSESSDEINKNDEKINSNTIKSTLSELLKNIPQTLQ